MYRIPTMLLMTLVAGCAEPSRGDPLFEVEARSDAAGETVDAAGDASSDSAIDTAEPPISFADGVHELLIDSCTDTGCHGSGAGSYPLTGDLEADYIATLDQVVPGDALASKLIKKASNTSSHTGGPVFQEGTPEYELVVAWINDGANP